MSCLSVHSLAPKYSVAVTEIFHSPNPMLPCHSSHASRDVTRLSRQPPSGTLEIGACGPGHGRARASLHWRGENLSLRDVSGVVATYPLLTPPPPPTGGGVWICLPAALRPWHLR